MMRSGALVLLAPFVFVLACGGASSATLTDGGTDADTDTSSGSGASTAMSSAPTSTSSSACSPGTAIVCTCADSSKGTQACRLDGAGYEECDCEGGGSNSASDGTTATGSSGSATEGSGTTGEATSGSSGDDTSGEPCVDPGPEPNDKEGDAVALGDQLCSAAPQTLAGALSGAGDVDWFSYHGTWNPLCLFGPDTAHTLTASEDVRLCVFAECDDGVPAFACQGGVMAQSPNGLPGCCNSGDVDFTLDCGLLNDNARLYIRLDEAPADACVEYAVEYSFDD